VEISLVRIADFCVLCEQLDLIEVLAIVDGTVVGPSAGPDESESRVGERDGRAEGLAIDFEIEIGVD
jgi:hypothetical protein